MRAAVLTEHGTPASGEFREPEPRPGQAVVEVSAAGLNPIDVLAASGVAPALRPPLPSVVGREGVGTLDGRRVYFNPAIAPFGSMAERALIDPAHVFDVPDDVGDGMAVAIGIAGTAAWVSLEWRARLREGETVLVLGASGLVGQLAVQAARLLGAGRVVAAARSASGLERAAALGADATVSLAEDPSTLAERFRDAAGGGVDVIVDPIWGPAAIAGLQAAGPGGRLVQLGHSAAASAELAPAFLRGGLVSILGYSSGGAPADVRRDAYARMARHAGAGELVAQVEPMALAEVARAWEHQAASPHTKLILVP